MRLLDEEFDDDWYASLREPYDVMEVVLPKISGFLSMVGSAIIISEIVLDHRAKKGSVISRVLLNLSLGDWFSSFAFFLSSWPVPRYSNVVYAWNVGNEATCSAQGFILILGVTATPIFNVILAWCQYSIITNGTKESQLQRLEKYFYIFVWTFALSFSSVLLSFEMFNAEYFVCGIAPYPHPCTQSWEADEEDNPADCIRGDNAFIALLFQYLILWAAILCVFVLLVRTIRSVQKAEQKSMRRTIVSASTMLELGDTSFSNSPTPNLWRTRLMRQHAYRYIAAFLSTYFVPTVQIILFNMFFHPTVTPIMLNIIVLTMPLQGFLNFLVFSGKREMKTRAGRLLKKLTYPIFWKCCCWPKPRSDPEGAPGNTNPRARQTEGPNNHPHDEEEDTGAAPQSTSHWNAEMSTQSLSWSSPRRQSLGLVGGREPKHGSERVRWSRGEVKEEEEKQDAGELEDTEQPSEWGSSR